MTLVHARHAEREACPPADRMTAAAAVGQLSGPVGWRTLSPARRRLLDSSRERGMLGRQQGLEREFGPE